MMRFNFTIPDDGALEQLQAMTRRTSKAEVVRDALAIYKMLVQRASRGEKFFIGHSRSDATELTITSLEHLQQQVLR